VRELEVGSFTLHCLPRSLQGEAARTRFQTQNQGVPGALDAQWITVASVVVGAGDGETRRIVLPPDWHR